jgi:hypothetical protein
MKITLLIIVFVLLTGCHTCPPCVPLVTKPEPPPEDSFIRPELEIEGLTDKSNPSEVIRAYVLSTKHLMDHVEYLEKVLTGYK